MNDIAIIQHSDRAEVLFERIASLIIEARQHIVRMIDTAMVSLIPFLAWMLIPRIISRWKLWMRIINLLIRMRVSL